MENKVEYNDDIFYGVEPSLKTELLNKSKDFMFVSSVGLTEIENIFVGVVVKTSTESKIKLEETVYFHKLNVGNTTFNEDVVCMKYSECYLSLDILGNELDLNFYNSECINRSSKKKVQKINPNLPLKYYIDKRIYENEQKKKLDFIWIFALNQVEFLRDPRRMKGKPFGREKAIKKVADNFQLDEKQLSNHHNARCQCVRWAKKDFENA